MALPVIHSDTYRLHAPTFEIWPGGYITQYFESPQRVDTILAALRSTEWADICEPETGRHDSLPLIVHDADYVAFIRNGFREWLAIDPPRPKAEPPTYYPSTVPPPRWRRKAGRPKNPLEAYGYYTFDLTAPLVEGTFEAALGSARCAMTAATRVLYGEPVTYALCRPPGHHAGRDFSGGYCYFNNTAIAAKILSMRGPVAILDIDYHHGNGTQDIFYEDDRVLTISIHADPGWEYPFFMGYADELGAGAGEGCNLNVPLPPHTTGAWYLKSIELVLDRIHLFQPWALVVAVGFDTYGGDPISKFSLTTEDYAAIVQRISSLQLPTVIVQEGGYNIEALGRNVVAFLEPFSLMTS
jgi:acetoin utilization deacetylase AcuC-like enzyme